MDMGTKHIILAVSAFAAGLFARPHLDRYLADDVPVAASPEPVTGGGLAPIIDAPQPAGVVAPEVFSGGGAIPYKDSVKPEVLTTRGQKHPPFDPTMFAGFQGTF